MNTNALIAFGICAFLAFVIGLALQRFILPKKKEVTGFPFGVTALLLGIGMYFDVFTRLSSYVPLLFIALLAAVAVYHLVLRRP